MSRYKRGHKPNERHVRLPEYLLSCAAWQALSPPARALYVEIKRRYRGPDSNNGRIPFSVREAAAALGVGRDTANRSFVDLTDKGFIVAKKRSGFNIKGRTATEWLLTEHSDDTVVGQMPLKLFMRWSPENSFHSPITDTDSPTTSPVVDLRSDCVASAQR